MILNVEFDKRKKARFVAGCHRINDPGKDAYSGAVAPEAIQLGMLAALCNNLKVIAADISDVYLLRSYTLVLEMFVENYSRQSLSV